ncbi:hypothetical protein WDU94_010765 [Cyamophila willieti]
MSSEESNVGSPNPSINHILSDSESENEVELIEQEPLNTQETYDLLCREEVPLLDVTANPDQTDPLTRFEEICQFLGGGTSTDHSEDWYAESYESEGTPPASEEEVDDDQEANDRNVGARSTQLQKSVASVMDSSGFLQDLIPFMESMQEQAMNLCDLELKKKTIIWTRALMALRAQLGSDVFAEILFNPGQMEELVRLIMSRFSATDTLGVFIIASHVDHLHVIHDCTWTSSTCRCAAVRRLESISGSYAFRIKRWVIRKHKFMSTHLVNTLLYLRAGRRSVKYCQLGRVRIRPGSRSSVEARYPAIQSWIDNGEKRLVAVHHLSFDDHLLSELGVGLSCKKTEGFDHDAHGNETGGRSEGRKQRSKGTHGDRLLEFLRSFPTAPVSSILHTKHWADSEFKLLHRGDKLLATIMTNYCVELCDMSMTDLFNRYNLLEFNSLLFATPLGNTLKALSQFLTNQKER